ncbi:MAG TPA: hypothetical protein VFY23_03815 [Candidatus Limnocylindrales bacterium]|nr:hypothetical protein [Candidatus Limnocylindrales bacterium]
MSLTLAGWSPIGIAAAILIVAGIALLVAWVLRRGVHARELDGMDPAPAVAATAVAGAIDTGPLPAPSRRQQDGSRTMGLVGATLLVVGLGLGVVSAASGWGSGTASTGGPGGASAEDCAQTWTGCPQATPLAP